MKLKPINHAAILVLGLALAACASNSGNRPQITNYEAPGNLESTQALSCEEVSNLSNTYTPPDLYRGMVKCAEDDNYPSAVYFFALAGTYSYYDTLRVSDSSAHQAHSVLLQRSLNSLKESKKRALWSEITNTLGTRDELSAVCKDVSRIGAPQYHPRYMIQHGMSAFVGGISSDGLVKSFDSGNAWKKSLSGYLHCSGL